MGSFDDNMPLTRITPAKPWERRLPQRNPRQRRPAPSPEPDNTPDNQRPDPDSAGSHIDEYA